ncbi:MAG: restriction endonuclease subunit S [Steroidobacteraceae bacterium]
MPGNAALKTIPLSKTTKFIVDNRGRTAPTAETGIPLIATNCISNDRLYPAYENLRFVSQETYDNWFRSHPQPGDIILTNKGSQNGAICLVPDPVDFVIAQDMVALRADEQVIDPCYLFAALRSPNVQRDIKNLDVSGVIPHFKKTDFDKLHLPYPARDVQEAIGKIYFDFSAKIELNRRMTATLETIARALFKSWFVDFDPVRAKLDGRKPGSMDDATAALFPDSFQDSELGNIPKSWQVKTLGEVIELAYGKPLKAENRKNGPVIVYGANGPVGEHDEKLVSGPGIVVGRKGNPGVVTWAHNDFYPIDTTFYVVPLGPCRSLYFLFYALSLHNLANLSADSAVPGLNRNHAYMSKQIVPSPDALEAFDFQISPIFDAMHANERQSRSLATLRDTLLPRLLSGELTTATAG